MSDRTADALQRWLPAIAALVAILCNILWLGNKAGAMEQRIEYVQTTATLAVTKAEYAADKAGQAAQLNDVKLQLREISAKLDRLVERQH